MDRVQGLKSEPSVNKSCLRCITQWGTCTARAGNLFSNPMVLAAAAPLSLPVPPAPNDSLLFCLTKRSQSGCLRDSKEQNPVSTSRIKVYHTQWLPWLWVFKYPNASVLLTNDLSCLPPRPPLMYSFSKACAADPLTVSAWLARQRRLHRKLLMWPLTSGCNPH